MEVKYEKKVPGQKKHVNIDHFRLAVMVNLYKLNELDSLIQNAGIVGRFKEIEKSKRHLSLLMIAIPIKPEWDVAEKRKEIARRVKEFVLSKLNSIQPNLSFLKLDYWPAANKIVAVFKPLVTDEFSQIVNEIFDFIKREISENASLINKTMVPSKGLQPAIAPHVSLADATSNFIKIVRPDLPSFVFKIDKTYPIIASVIDLKKTVHINPMTIGLLSQSLNSLLVRQRELKK